MPEKPAPASPDRLIEVALDETGLARADARDRAGAARRDLRPHRGQPLRPAARATSGRCRPVPTGSASPSANGGSSSTSPPRRASVGEFHLSLSPFNQVVKDYFQICESYFDAVKRLPPAQIEAIDMGRRGIHDEGSRILLERLEGKVETDMATARRLFTLICALHRPGLTAWRPNPQSVLFCCDHNAVRSPMAEGIMKKFYGTRIYVQSAGVRNDLEIDGFSIAVCAEIGVELERHRTRSFKDMEQWGDRIDAYDLIVALSPGRHAPGAGIYPLPRARGRILADLRPHRTGRGPRGQARRLPSSRATRSRAASATASARPTRRRSPQPCNLKPTSGAPGPCGQTDFALEFRPVWDHFARADARPRRLAAFLQLHRSPHGQGRAS